MATDRPNFDTSINVASTPGAVVLTDLPTFPIPTGHNEPLALLAAWTALEALSPQTFRRPEDLAAGDRSCVADISGGLVPWGTGERSRPNYTLYYQVVLGSIPMDRATDELIRAFGEDEERRRREREKAAIAIVLVDKDGVVLGGNAIAVSSFAWALPLALNLELNSLGAWTAVEPRLAESLEQILQRVDSDGRPVPLDLQTIHKAHDWIITQFRLPAHLVEPPTFALRVYHHVKAKNPPEPPLLNSFYLGELARASKLIQQDAAGLGLRRYLGMSRPQETFDLLVDKQALERTTAPSTFPAARWPHRGGHPLVLLQQAAVNVARAELERSEGIVAVNGPPGTGKTTLLRDLIAQCVLDRALAMASFDDPEAAFTPSGPKISAGDRAFFHIYRLDPRLKGHEIVVASSNNKAVENVSKDIPAAAQIASTAGDLTYFKSVSDFVFSRRVNERREQEEIQPEPVETWGLIAAVLGNASNRNSFLRAFWWDDERSLRLYLKAAKGDSVVREIKDPKTGKVLERRTPYVVLAERPPTSAAAKANWRAARARLLALKKQIDAELAALEQVRKDCLRAAKERKSIESAEAEYRQAAAGREQAEALLAERKVETDDWMRDYRARLAALDLHRHARPNLFARLFRTQRWKAWSMQQTPLAEAKRETARGLAASKKALLEATTTLEVLSVRLRTLESALLKPRRKIAKLELSIDPWRSILGERLVDAQFLARSHEHLNLSSAWLPDSLQRKREELFAAAMAVHRAFIDASAQKVLHNLSWLMDVLASGALRDETKRELLTDLWSTFFAVVPVISTTFASVDRMLGDLPPASIGWLFIDEAGQALPQAAVGAIMRAKRSVVVGDPLQIPPFVSLPERLMTEICAFFNVDHGDWAAPEASVQTLADRTSRFQSAFESDRGPRRVGAPLLVHRRCQDPMFSVSNVIAYNGLMVHAPGPRDPGPIGGVLGPPQWFDLDGEAQSKWCEAEGELVIDLLHKLAAAGIVRPDLFIISPFRIVAQSMRRRLERDVDLLKTLCVDPEDWLSERVGTIHTFQGGETDTVILLLGAPKATQHGARSWAVNTPNILNVAVSRAKQNFYVVGSHGAWSGVGHCRELARHLSVVRCRLAD